MQNDFNRVLPEAEDLQDYPELVEMTLAITALIVTILVHVLLHLMLFLLCREVMAEMVKMENQDHKETG